MNLSTTSWQTSFTESSAHTLITTVIRMLFPTLTQISLIFNFSGVFIALLSVIQTAPLVHACCLHQAATAYSKTCGLTWRRREVHARRRPRWVIPHLVRGCSERSGWQFEVLWEEAVLTPVADEGVQEAETAGQAWPPKPNEERQFLSLLSVLLGQCYSGPSPDPNPWAGQGKHYLKWPNAKMFLFLPLLRLPAAVLQLGNLC